MILLIKESRMTSLCGDYHKDIDTMRGGKLKKLRIWTNLHKWKYKTGNIYIKQTYILLELLQHIPKITNHL